MKDLIDLFVGLFKTAHPLTQFFILFICLISVIFWISMFLRERDRRKRDWEELCRLRIEAEAWRKEREKSKEESDSKAEDIKGRLKNEFAQKMAEYTRRYEEIKHKFEEARTKLGEIAAQLQKEKDRSKATLDAYEKLSKQATMLLKERDLLKQRIDEAKSREKKLCAEINEFRQRFGSLDNSSKLIEELEAGRKQIKDLEDEIADFENRTANLDQIDANIWVTPLKEQEKSPPFIHRDSRQTRIVTFLNLKGGVGKTTITANLAAAFATGVMGDCLRVLVIDLDFQGSLSNLCAERQFLDDRRTTNRTADRLISVNGDGIDLSLLAQLCMPLKEADGNSKLIAADDRLEHIDFRQQAKFVIDREEVRYFHRQFIHTKSVFDQFDLVFFDCPPRLTASSINALLASDWVVIPTGPDPNDLDTVPRTMRWLQKLKTNNIDFQGDLAGVIINSTYSAGTVKDLTVMEKKSVEALRKSIEGFPAGSGAVFNNIIKSDSRIVKTAQQGILFGTTDDGRQFYRNIAKELLQRIKYPGALK